jgi:hypothetical protein
MENYTEYNLLEQSKITLKRKIALRVRQAEHQLSSMQSSSKISKSSNEKSSTDESSSENESSTEEESSGSETDGSEDGDDSNFAEYEEFDSVINLLRDLLTEFNSCAPFVNRLLPILQQAGLTYLPKTYETFMKTDAHNYDVEHYQDGQYVHYGLKNKLLEQLSSLESPFNQNCININANIDGTPLTKSSGSQFWPILGLSNIPGLNKPFEIGIFSSPLKKPRNTDFLKKFISEAAYLQSNGLMFENKKYSVKIKLIICDTPANSFILHTKGHTGFESCRKCIVHGVTIENRRCFPETDCERRTDSSFRAQTYPGHHKGITPLLSLDIDMVKNVPLDYMHLVCLGVMKTLLLFWVTPVKNGPKRLTADKVLVLEENLHACLSSQPTEFSRRIRSTQQLKFWKATEFRTFLLYIGPVILKNVLPHRQFQHFMKLHCAIQILIKDSRLIYLEKAQQLLIEFVQEMLLKKNPLYGNHYVGYNFHNLIHLPEDVSSHGKLDNFSSFPFENRLFFLKGRLRGANKPLEQITNRLAEIQKFRINKSSISVYPLLSRPKPIKDIITYSKITMKDFVLDDSSKNKWFMTNDMKVFAFSYATKENNTVFLHSQQAQNLENFYDTTFNFDSRLINISKSSQITENHTIIPIDDFNTKVFCLKTNNNMVFFPL